MLIQQLVIEWLVYARHYFRYCGNNDDYQQHSLHPNVIYIVLEETESTPDKWINKMSGSRDHGKRPCIP